MPIERKDFKPLLEDEIVKILQDNLGSAHFKEYYIGDPLAIPQHKLPCVVVEVERATSEAGPTGMDQLRFFVVIKLIYNKKTDFVNKPNEVSGYRELRYLAQGVDLDNNEVSQSSVVGILRKNFTLGTLIENQIIDIQYGLTPRPEDVITEEAQIRVAIDQLTTVSGRV